MAAYQFSDHFFLYYPCTPSPPSVKRHCVIFFQSKVFLLSNKHDETSPFLYLDVTLFNQIYIFVSEESFSNSTMNKLKAFSLEIKFVIKYTS